MKNDRARADRFDGHEYPQVLPEPDDVRDGAPAPWAALTAQERQGISIDLVLRRLAQGHRSFDASPIPSEPLDMRAVAVVGGRHVTRRSAVLVALFEEDGETHIILTRRARTLTSHRGEIALPGGRSDRDENPVTTALREAYEEVGLDPSLVDLVGWLSPVMTFAPGSAIWPVVGVLAGRPDLVIQPSEVERVFTVPLAQLIQDGVFLEERWKRPGPRPGADADGYFPIQFFRVPGDVIWGATARVLTELLCLVTGATWPDADRVWG
jgi:8-oxo-dGTP pyrophosphatase MutT (NUDIX family)